MIGMTATEKTEALIEARKKTLSFRAINKLLKSENSRKLAADVLSKESEVRLQYNLRKQNETTCSVTATVIEATLHVALCRRSHKGTKIDAAHELIILVIQNSLAVALQCGIPENVLGGDECGLAETDKTRYAGEHSSGSITTLLYKPCVGKPSKDIGVDNAKGLIDGNFLLKRLVAENVKAVVQNTQNRTSCALRISRRFILVAK